MSDLVYIYKLLAYYCLLMQRYDIKSNYIPYNQDGFGGANGWWLWIIVLFWLWGGRGFGNGFGNGGDNCANGLPAQLNNDYGRELLMQAI